MEFGYSHVRLNRNRPHTNRSNKPSFPNIVKYRLGHLDTKNETETFSGDPIYCENPICTAILTSISQLGNPNPVGNRKRIWICEYCRRQNLIDVSDGQIPPTDVTFFLSPAADDQDQPFNIPSFGTEIMKYLVYCIDTSASMSETTEVWIKVFSMLIC